MPCEMITLQLGQCGNQSKCFPQVQGFLVNTQTENLMLSDYSCF